MSKHTPGPWHWREHVPNFCKVGAVGVTLCDVNLWSHGVAGCAAENEANARLIAAAPDLLEACEELLAEYAHLHALYNLGECDGSLMARAAIAKATGEQQ